MSDTLPGVLVLLLALGALPAWSEGPTFPLTVVVHGARSDAGVVGCSLYADARGFPVEPSEARELRWCTWTDDGAVCRFTPVPPASYAVACFHDENRNERLDRGFLGIPVEGYAVSNNARGVLGPPRFADACFSLERPTTLTLRLGY